MNSEIVDVQTRSDIEKATARIIFNWTLAKREGDHVIVEIRVAHDAELTFEGIG